MKSKTPLLIIVFVLFALGIGGYFVFRSGGQDSATSGVSQKTELRSTEVSGNFVKGQKVPDATFTDFEGNLHMLSDFEGRAVVLDFWAAWCPFCVAEMPLLQAAQDKYADDLVMIGVHRTDTEKKERGLEFAKERGVTYLLLSDDGSLYRAAGGFGMPVAVFIDKDGVVQEIKSGPKTAEEIEERTGKLVNSN